MTTHISQRQTSAACIASLGIVLAAASATAQITTFSVPGAGTAAFQGTSALAQDAVGTIMGYYSDASGVFHGFLRARHGSFTTFDAPGAGTGASPGHLRLRLQPGGGDRRVLR